MMLGFAEFTLGAVYSFQVNIDVFVVPTFS